MRDPHNHQSRGFGFITFQRDDSAKQVLQNRYHDMLGKRVEVKSAVPRGQAPPPQRGPPRSSQGYGYGQPRGGPGGAAGPGYGYSGQQYGAPQAGGAPGAYDGANPWGTLGGDAAGGQKPGYGYAGDGSKPPCGTADASSHGWTEHTAPEHSIGSIATFAANLLSGTREENLKSFREKAMNAQTLHSEIQVEMEDVRWAPARSLDSWVKALDGR